MVEIHSFIHPSIEYALPALVFCCGCKPLWRPNFYDRWRCAAMVMLDIVFGWLGGSGGKDDRKSIHSSIHHMILAPPSLVFCRGRKLLSRPNFNSRWHHFAMVMLDIVCDWLGGGRGIDGGNSIHSSIHQLIILAPNFCS